jgi:hypothetical protein
MRITASTSARVLSLRFARQSVLGRQLLASRPAGHLEQTTIDALFPDQLATARDENAKVIFMVAVELKDAAGHVLVQFHIMAVSELPESVVDAQLELVQPDSAFGLRYYFLVTNGWVRGWDIASATQIFRAPTAALFAAYTGRSETVLDAGIEYLAELTHAWISDLTYHWQSRGVSAPGEGDMLNGGVLGLVRSAATAVTAGV